jgi:hypothetical protein
MGAWGPAVFSDDLALDVRGEWRDALIAGEDPAAVTNRLEARYGTDVVFWLALAAAQHETGHLQDRVRDRALAEIEAGADLELWEEAGQRGARERVLRRLAAKLTGPQPKPKRLRGPRPGPDPGVEAGDIVRIYNRARTRSALFAVTKVPVIDRSHYPRLLGLFWEGGQVPPRAELAQLPYLSSVDLSAFDGDEPPEHMGVAFPYVRTILVVRRGDELRPELGEVVARGVNVRDDWDGPPTMTGWRGIAGLLEPSGAYDILLKVTRRRLERYSDDPDAWRREREELFGPGSAMAQEALAQIEAWSDADERPDKR